MPEWKTGGCHCGAVRFEVRSEADSALICNCSICSMKGYLHLIVPRADFRLISGEADLSLYQFNTGAARHYFCRVCGVSPHYIPRSHPDGVDVNMRCLDQIDLEKVRLEQFDGRNWENNIHSIAGYDS